MPSHIHAELMMEYAQDAMTTDEPWELWEFKWKKDKKWDSLHNNPQWTPVNEYRRKPKTVNINGFEVVQELAKEGEKGFVEVVNAEDFYREFDCACGLIVERGIAHKTFKSAVASCKARLGIDPNS